MIRVHPQYIKDGKGKTSMVVIPAKEFEIIMEELEELADVRLYDKAKKEDNGQRILFSEYLKNRQGKKG